MRRIIKSAEMVELEAEMQRALGLRAAGAVGEMVAVLAVIFCLTDCLNGTINGLWFAPVFLVALFVGLFSYAVEQSAGEILRETEQRYERVRRQFNPLERVEVD